MSRHGGIPADAVPGASLRGASGRLTAADTRAGLAGMVGCCLIWGLSPVYYKLVAQVPAAEVLAHRTLWSLVFFGIVLAIQRRLGELRPLLRPGRPMAMTVLAAVTISVNWLGFIVAVQTGHTLEASLGYYIFPLVAALFGMTLFGERLAPAQLAALGLAAGGVCVMAVGLGAPPWISLLLAGSFAIYGACKKVMAAGPVVSVTAEVSLLAPLAALWLVLAVPGGGAFAASLRDAGLLALSGPLTAVPLLLFSYASRRLSMATMGVTAYLNPTLQFLCAVAVFGEPFGAVQAAAFALIWAGLAVYSAAAIRRERLSRRSRAGA